MHSWKAAVTIEVVYPPGAPCLAHPDRSERARQVCVRLAETRNIGVTTNQDGRAEIAGANDVAGIKAQASPKGRAEIDAAIACEGGVLELERAVIDLDAR